MIHVLHMNRPFIPIAEEESVSDADPALVGNVTKQELNSTRSNNVSPFMLSSAPCYVPAEGKTAACMCVNGIDFPFWIICTVKEL